jgi:hypothetical protein
MRCGALQHMLGLLKSIREQTRKQLGDTIKVQIWKDDGDRTVEVPADLATLMNTNGLRWITEARKEETRSRRLVKAIEMLRQGIKTPG